VEGVAGGVDADEGMAGFDPVQEPLGIRQRQVAGGAGEDHAVIVFQVVRREFLQRGFQAVLPSGFGGLVGGFLIIRRVRLRFGGLVGRLMDKIHGEGTAFGTQLRKNFFRGGNGAVAETGGGGDDQEFLGSVRSVQGGHRQQGG